MKRYRIYYKIGSSGVAEVDTLAGTIVTASYVEGETFTVSSLSPNVQYVSNIWTYDEMDNSSSATEIVKYTAADVPGVPTITDGITSTAMNVATDPGGNPPGTEFAIYETGTGTYVQSDGTLGAASAVWQAGGTSSGQWGESTGTIGKVTVNGLTPNTLYTFQVKARNGDNTETVLGASGLMYTLAAVPASLTASQNSAASSSQIDTSWGANSNASGTEYYAENATAGTNSGWITDTVWSSSGLSCNTGYAFKVKARNADSVETAYTSNVTGVTGNCGGVILPPSSRSRTKLIEEDPVVEEDPEVGEDEVASDSVSGGSDESVQSQLADELASSAGGETTEFVEENSSELLTRGAAVKAICLMLGIDLEDFDIVGVFSDVLEDDDWYFAYVFVAKSLGFVDGDPSGVFRPGDYVRRVEAVKMIVEAVAWDLIDTGAVGFEDVLEGQWYMSYLRTALANGLLDSYLDDLNFGPSENVTVQEFLEMLAFFGK